MVLLYQRFLDLWCLSQRSIQRATLRNIPCFSAYSKFVNRFLFTHDLLGIYGTDHYLTCLEPWRGIPCS